LGLVLLEPPLALPLALEPLLALFYSAPPKA
jgi:hypothetical protein